MITLNGLHPKGLRNAYCWSRRELKDKLDGIINPDTLEQYIADEASKRYHEPPITVMITCYAVYQALLAAGECPVNERAISQYLVNP
jgi:hypothetical protein